MCFADRNTVVTEGLFRRNIKDFSSDINSI